VRADLSWRRYRFRGSLTLREAEAALKSVAAGVGNEPSAIRLAAMQTLMALRGGKPIMAAMERFRQEIGLEKPSGT
jgi:hypothetical protein